MMKTLDDESESVRLFLSLGGQAALCVQTVGGQTALFFKTKEKRSVGDRRGECLDMRTRMEGVRGEHCQSVDETIT